MDKVVLTVDLLAQIVCLTRREQMDLLKEVAKGESILVWHAETHCWVLEPKEKPRELGSKG